MPLPNPTVVFRTFWEFASKRCQAYEQRLTGAPQPWTNDPILQHFKFTNVFRACDRVSQYLIKVIYEPTASQHPEEVVFRILLFKLFNSILAWEILKAKFDMPTWNGFNQQAYAAVLGNAKAQGANIWNMAYVQNQNYVSRRSSRPDRCRRRSFHQSGICNKDKIAAILRLCTTWIIARAGMDKTVPALFLSADIRKCCARGMNALPLPSATDGRRSAELGTWNNKRVHVFVGFLYPVGI